MPVQKNRMSAGQFTLKLKDDTPDTVIQAYAIASKGFGHVVITSSPIDALGTTTGFTSTNLFALSIYTGVYRAESGSTRLTTLEGSHASVWLGDQDGKATFASPGSATQSFVNWVAAIKPPQLGTGTVTATGSNQLYNYGYQHSGESSPREALDVICGMYSAEWEVTDTLKLNAGTTSAIYGSTPSVIVSPFLDGRDQALIGLRATVKQRADLEDYEKYTFLVYNSGGSTVQSSAGSLVFKDGYGAASDWARRIESSTITSATEAGNLVAQQNARFNAVRNALDVSTDSPAVMADVRCGAYIYVWHPDVAVYDFANEITYRGTLIWPLITRVEAVTMPITRGLGVQFVDGDGTITDLTRYVEWETGSATITVGAPVRSLRGSVVKQSGVPVPAV